MNFYKRYPGDYMGKTAHLSLIEHGAYNVLLDHVYSNESPLPAEPDACYRIARAFSKEERAAVDSVLAKFFVLSAIGYTNDRVQKEIAKASDQAEKNKANGKRGGRPKQTEEEPNDNPCGYCDDGELDSQTKGIPDYQTTRLPDAINQKPEREADKPPRPKFLKPTIPEIREYCQSVNSSINPVTFFNHYETVGWKVGKNTMKDWKAAVRNWTSRENK